MITQGYGRLPPPPENKDRKGWGGIRAGDVVSVDFGGRMYVGCKVDKLDHDGIHVDLILPKSKQRWRSPFQYLTIEKKGKTSVDQG